MFIAGAGGFIGRGLTTWLEAQGLPVYGADKRALEGAANVAAVDLLDLRAVCSVLKDCLPAVIFHTAGAVGITDETILDQAHVTTTHVLLSAAKSVCPSARVVVIGSAAEYGLRMNETKPVAENVAAQPESVYGRSKFKQSELAQTMGRELGLDVIRVRLFNTLGPGQGTQLVAGAMVQRLHQALAQGGQQFEVFDADSVRDFLDIRDVARLMWLVARRARRDVEQLPIQIASGEGISIRELANCLLQVANALGHIQVQWRTSDRPTSSIGEPLTLRNLIGHKPIRQISLSESLKDMWAWHSRPHLCRSQTWS